MPSDVAKQLGNYIHYIPLILYFTDILFLSEPPETVKKPSPSWDLLVVLDPVIVICLSIL
nr:MAG TPA: hypothetical protein [Caudoviricetes sp.]